ncbi:hypothetical protein [Glutamicibacter soli]
MENATLTVIGDKDGMAVVGDSDALDKFFAASGLIARDMKLDRVGKLLNNGAVGAQTASSLMENSGRWVKLTKESAKIFDPKNLMKGSNDGVSRAIVMNDGKISNILEIATGPGTALLGPAALPVLAGMMAQQAMQQSFDEILDYLAVIDEKVDDILRAQKDQIFAELVAVGELIEEALVLRERVGKVGEVTWSKVQANSMSIARTQDIALRMIEALAEKLEKKAKMGDLAKIAIHIEAKTIEWVMVLARSFQLSEAMSVIELDRVLDSNPEDVEAHRTGLQIARNNRIERISNTTGQLLERILETGASANSKVLLHPKSATQVVKSTNRVSSDLHDFRARLGIESNTELVAAKTWKRAVGDARDKVVGVGADGIGAVRQFGDDTKERAIDKAESMADSLAETIRNRRESKLDVTKELEK